MITKLITGMQSGVDHAAREFCSTFGISFEISLETHRNIEKSDGTLVIAAEEILGETASLVEYAREFKKPCLLLDLNQYPSPQLVIDWMEKHRINTLNVIGPDEDALPGIYKIAYEFLIAVFYAFPHAGGDG